jgi:hypothetical protein
MVVYSAQPIKVGAARSCGGAPEIKLRPCRLAGRREGQCDRDEHRSHAARAEIFTHPVAIRQQQRCVPYAI